MYDDKYLGWLAVIIGVLLLVITALNPQPPEWMTGTTSGNLEALLVSPANNSNHTTGFNVTLTANCSTNGTLVGATFWVFYVNGTLVESKANESGLANATNFFVYFEAPETWDNYTWLVNCEDNYSMTVNDSERYFNLADTAGDLAYYPAGTTGFEYECNGTKDVNVLKTPTNQSNATALLCFNNTGVYNGQLNLTANYSPHNLEYWFSQDDNYSNAVHVPATSNATLNESVAPNEHVFLWVWVNCSNSTVNVTEPTTVYTSIDWWFWVVD